MNFQLFKLDLEKAEEPLIKLPTSTGSLKKQKSSRKTSTSVYWLCHSLWRCRTQQTVENSSRDGNTRPPDLPPEKPVCKSGSNGHNWTWNNELVQDWERSTSRLYMNRELLDVQAGFRKGRGTRNQIANVLWIIEKAREFQKNIYFCLLTMPKPLTVWTTTNCGKFFKRWEYQITWPASWEIWMQVKKQQSELDMEQ